MIDNQYEKYHGDLRLKNQFISSTSKICLTKQKDIWIKELKILKDKQSFECGYSPYWTIKDINTNKSISNKGVVLLKENMYQQLVNDRFFVYCNNKCSMKFFVAYLSNINKSPNNIPYCEQIDNTNLFNVFKSLKIDNKFGTWQVLDEFTNEKLGNLVQDVDTIECTINGRYLIHTKNEELLNRLYYIGINADSIQYFNLTITKTENSTEDSIKDNLNSKLFDNVCILLIFILLIICLCYILNNLW